MNVIEANPFSPQWTDLGLQFGTGACAKWPKPNLILSISAHWLTDGWWLTAMAQPKTIHDFGGFPQALFDQNYPAPGAPEVAQFLSRFLRQPSNDEPLALDSQDWGLDHGTWSVLKLMFPLANIPVVQLSMDYGRPPQEHFDLGRQLRPLRDQGVLILATGNMVHNLRLMRIGVSNSQAYEWAIEFDRISAEHIRAGRLQELTEFARLGQIAQYAHPTHEHYLPLLYAGGAVHPSEPLVFFNEAYQGASIAMRSVIWG
jgi:4,5-DOPA dioxygenase extradiol